MPRTFTAEDRAKAIAAKAVLAKDPSGIVKRDLRNLFKELLDAAYGRGKYGGFLMVKCDGHEVHRIGIPSLPPERRLTALFKALEYGMGRPISIDKTPSPKPESDEEESRETYGLTIA